MNLKELALAIIMDKETEQAINISGSPITSCGTLGEIAHPYIGKYVIVRSNGSGVHSGYIKSYDDKTHTIFLNKSRRLWMWKGFTLSQVANEGMVSGAKVAQELPEIMITNVLELIPCSEKAKENLSKYEVYVP